MQVSSTADASVAPVPSNVASPYSDSSAAQYAPANPEPLAPGLTMGFSQLPRFMPLRWPGTAIAYESLHILAASLLASYPWVFALGVVQTEAITWPGWLALIGAQGLCMIIRSPRSRLIPFMSLGLLLGLCFIQATLVYHSIVLSGIQRDYFLLGDWIDQAAHDFRTIPINTENVLQASHLQIYFDFISPAVNRVLQLTHDPFRLLAFHFIAIAGGSIVTWIIAVTNEHLRPFQIILPVIFMMHPSVPLTINSDYHTSGIGVAFFIVGTYLFGIQRHRSAFVILLIGTLTKISFWPSWLMFGVLHAFRRRWLWALSYAMPGCAAIVLYCVIQPPGQKGTVDFFFPYLGSSPAEVATNAILKPHLWIGHALDPLRLSFFALLLLPLGFAVFRRLDLLAPTLPLAAFSLADSTWQRTIVSDTYGSEYLGFCFAAVLVGLLVSSRRVQAFMLAAMTFGMMIWLANPYQWVGFDHLVPDSYRAWVPANPNGDDMRARERAYADEYVRLYWSPVRHKLSRSLAQTNEYLRATAMSECAVGDAPVIVTSYNWATYIRGYWSQVWVDSKGRQEYEPPIDSATWERVETLVYPGTAETAGTFVNFPETTGPYDVLRYATLMDRLPTTVEIDESRYRWHYLGGERLADCAAKFGYATRPTTVGLGQLISKPEP